MEQRSKTYIKIAVAILIVLGISGYSLYQARNLIKGPTLTITSPEDGTTVTDPLVHIVGKAGNVTYISLNDNQIYVDGTGAFKEDMLLSPGYNVWTLEAKDKFGRVVRKNIELVFKKS